MFRRIWNMWIGFIAFAKQTSYSIKDERVGMVQLYIRQKKKINFENLILAQNIL